VRGPIEQGRPAVVPRSMPMGRWPERAQVEDYARRSRAAIVDAVEPARIRRRRCRCRRSRPQPDGGPRRGCPATISSGWTPTITRCTRRRSAAGSTSERLARLARPSYRLPPPGLHRVAFARPTKVLSTATPVQKRPARVTLFALIQRDTRNGMSNRAIADRHGILSRTVRQALTSPQPPPRKLLPPRGSRPDPYKPTIDNLLKGAHGRPRTAKTSSMPAAYEMDQPRKGANATA
jgi:hypothetical protein